VRARGCTVLGAHQRIPVSSLLPPRFSRSAASPPHSATLAPPARFFHHFTLPPSPTSIRICSAPLRCQIARSPMGCFQSKPAGKPLPPDADAALPADDPADPGKHSKTRRHCRRLVLNPSPPNSHSLCTYPERI
jgi:hypothetical protein